MTTAEQTAITEALLAAASAAVASLGKLAGVDVIANDTDRVDATDADLATAMLVHSSGPTGSVVMAVSEEAAQAFAEAAGLTAGDADAAWTELCRLGLDASHAFVGALSSSGLLVGPVTSAEPIEELPAGAADWSGVKVDATVGESVGTLWWLMAEPVRAAEAPAPAGADAAVAASDVQPGDVRASAPEAATQPEPVPMPMVDPVAYPELGAGMTSSTRAEMSLLSDVSMDVTVELGRTVMRVREVLQLSEGSVIELDRPIGAHVDVLVNGSPVARGEVVVIDDVLGVRISSVSNPHTPRP